MTTEVIIKNKTCIVLAADSAATVQYTDMGGKVYNTANKLFSLSKTEPVGVLVYNSSAINGIPVEIIIKEFRAQCKSYKTLKEYRTEFIKFVESFSKKHKDYDCIVPYFKGFLFEIKDLYKKKVAEDINDVISLCKEKIQKKNISGLDIKDILEAILKHKDCVDSFNKFKKEFGFKGEIKDISDLFYTHIPESMLRTFTGIAICGYGQDDFFPCVHRVDICGLFDNKLLVNNLLDATGKNPEIIPLAQRQMIDTFIFGFSGQMQSKFDGFFKDNFKTLLEALNPILTPEIKTGIESALKEKYEQNWEEFNKMIAVDEMFPLWRTLEHLSRDEVAELAESLVNLQALKYKVTPDLETVGGPVDVAIISKHDGFVWKKRKLYFPADLNFHFFENYFKGLPDTCYNKKREK